MERQALCDAVVRYNAEGLAGLHNRPKGHPPRRLTPDEEAALAAMILKGPDPEHDGTCAWTRGDEAPPEGTGYVRAETAEEAVALGGHPEVDVNPLPADAGWPGKPGEEVHPWR